MLKVKVSLSLQLKKRVSELSAEVFSTDSKILYYKICDVKVGSSKRYKTLHNTCLQKNTKKSFAQRKKK